jgi:hypothetical protein
MLSPTTAPQISAAAIGGQPPHRLGLIEGIASSAGAVIRSILKIHRHILYAFIHDEEKSSVTSACDVSWGVLMIYARSRVIIILHGGVYAGRFLL